MPEINAIPVTGTSWSIPRIDPVHFTAEKSAAVTADPDPSESDSSRVDFLWLDVVCIDQTSGYREKVREIGRQAKIVQEAAQVFVWLTTYERSYYINWLSKIDSFWHRLYWEICSIL